jgi:shikimate dehydrogenase
MTEHAMPRACLMGHPVAHSRSPMIHRHWLAQHGIAGAYELVDLTPADFPHFLANLRAHGYVGGNVTVPHKEAAWRLARRRDPGAEAIGAVNTIWFEGDEMWGGNSDAHGFIESLDEQAPGWNAAGARAVLLGAGGAAHAVAFALKARSVEVAVFNRTWDRARDLAARFGAGISAHRFEELGRLLAVADVLVNATSLGMVGEPPLEIDLSPLKRSAVVCDAVYVPLETGLLIAAATRGHRVVDGLRMLLRQAGYGFRKWFGVAPTVTPELRMLIEADIQRTTPRS